MAQGAFVLFEEFSLQISGTIKLSTDGFKVALIDDTLVAIASQATPELGDYTQVAGGNGYTTDGESLAAKSWAEVGGVATFDDTGTPSVSWTKNGSGPTNIFQALVYSVTATNKDCIGYIDMTSDGGTTPISLQAGDITITPHANGFFTISTP